MMDSLLRFAIVLVLGGLVACSPKDGGQPATPAAETTSAPAPAANAPAPAAVAVAVTPGGNIEQAAAASIGTAINGEILKTDQNDYYRFDVPLKQRDLAVIRLQNQSSTLKPDFKLFSVDRSLRSEIYDGTAGASAQTTVTLEPGQAIIVAVQNYDSTGKYTLSVTPQNAFDGHEPNDDVLSATPVAIGTDIEGSVMDGKDADWYRITGATQASIHVTLENQSTTLKPDLKMYSANKSLTGEKYDGTAGANLDFSFDVEPGKDFYLQLLPYDSTGKYKLAVKPATTPPATP